MLLIHHFPKPHGPVFSCHHQIAHFFSFFLFPFSFLTMNHQPSTTPQNSPVANSSPVHPPLIPHSKEVRTQSGSSQALLPHTQVFTYRCYLPVLTGLGEPGLRQT